jgi:ribonucleoside-diphosphate reductase alpha chain
MVFDDFGFSENAVEIFKKRYLRKDEKGTLLETIEDRLHSVANYIAEAEKEPGLKKYWAAKFFEIMRDRLFFPNTPCLRNAGANGGSFSACFYLDIFDSRESIFDVLKKSVEIQALGGGTGHNLSNMRPKGWLIKTTNGKASGPIIFASIYDYVIGNVIQQGGVRPGAQMGLLNIDHPDIKEFITCKEIEGNLKNFNISVVIPNWFMEGLKKKEFKFMTSFNGQQCDEIDGHKLWKMLIESAWKNGEPGVFFIDNVNNQSPTFPYQIMNGCNPSLCSETLVLTPEGYFQIKELENKNIKVFNINGEVQEAFCFKSGKDKQLWKLSTKFNGDSYCTKEHKWPTKNGKKETQFLIIGDLIPLSKGNNFKEDYDEVLSIEKTDRYEDVYDITVFDDTNTFQISSIITGNCGEQILGNFESCNLGSINLSQFVTDDLLVYEDDSRINWKHLKEVIRIAVRFLDNVIDVNNYPIPEIETETKKFRKVGLGIMGWADILIKLKISYNSQEALDLAEKVMKFINDESIKYSEELAKEKGFGTWEGYENIFKPNTPQYSDRENPLFYRRNATLTTIAPTGTISLLSGCSAGGEPVFSFEFKKKCLDGEMTVIHPLLLEWLLNHDATIEDIPDYFIESKDIPAEQHVKMQAAFQKYTDNAVSKTVNLPNDATIEDVDKIYRLAYELNCKGITVYRQGSREYEAQTAVVKEESINIVCTLCGQKYDVRTGHVCSEYDHLNHSSKIKTKELPPEKVEQARAAIGRLAKNYRKNSDPDIETPEWLPGWREKIKTGDGTLWVHVFTDPSTGFREVWTAVSKPGRTLAAAADSTGRLITLALKKGASWDEIVKQLQGHIGEKTAWNNGVQVLSIQDGTAQVLRRRCIDKNIPMVECPFEGKCHNKELFVLDNPIINNLIDRGIIPAKVVAEFIEEMDKKNTSNSESLDLEVVEAIEDKSRIIYQSQEEINTLHDFGDEVVEEFMNTDLCPDCGSVLLHDEGCKGGRCGTCGFSHCS